MRIADFKSAASADSAISAGRPFGRKDHVAKMGSVLAALDALELRLDLAELVAVQAVHDQVQADQQADQEAQADHDDVHQLVIRGVGKAQQGHVGGVGNDGVGKVESAAGEGDQQDQTEQDANGTHTSSP